MSFTNKIISDNDEENTIVLEGFLCPICKLDLKTPDLLTIHVDNVHSNDEQQDQDVVKSIKDIFKTATRKILYTDDSLLLTEAFDNTLKSKFLQISKTSGQNPPTFSDTSSGASGGGGGAGKATNLYPFNDDDQEIGVDCNHFAYFKAIRDPRLERYATETNKLIIRLNKLLTNRPTDPIQIKQHEQNLVPWLDGKSVKLCPNCAKKFNITRRQHHCRLCGSIICHECSRFIPEKYAYSLVSIPCDIESSDQESNAFRVCEHCEHLLENRKQMQDNRLYRPPIIVYYEKIQEIKKELLPDIQTYSKIINSLYNGDGIFTLADATALRGKIGRAAENIDSYSKSILNDRSQESSGQQNESLKKYIRLACINYIKEKMLFMEPIPNEEDIKKIQERRKYDTEIRIENERRQITQMMLDKYEFQGNTGGGGVVGGSGGSSKSNSYTNITILNNSATGSAVTSLDNWSGQQANTSSTSDPLIEQINIIKGYIKQARDACRFEEVEILELNLRELQQEFYNRQQMTATP